MDTVTGSVLLLLLSLTPPTGVLGGWTKRYRTGKRPAAGYGSDFNMQNYDSDLDSDLDFKKFDLTDLKYDYGTQNSNFDNDFGYGNKYGSSSQPYSYGTDGFGTSTGSSYGSSYSQPSFGSLSTGTGYGAKYSPTLGTSSSSSGRQGYGGTGSSTGSEADIAPGGGYSGTKYEQAGYKPSQYGLFKGGGGGGGGDYSDHGPRAVSAGSYKHAYAPSDNPGYGQYSSSGYPYSAPKTNTQYY